MRSGEETAIRALVGARLPTVNYEVWAKPANGGEPALVGKSVEYWAMRVALADDFTPGRETDVRAWFSPRTGPGPTEPTPTT